MTKKINKIFAVLLVVMLAVTMLAACGGAEEKKPTTINGLNLTVPEGFVEVSPGAQQWASPSYPEDNSNILILQGESESMFNVYTALIAKQAIEQEYEVYGFDVEVTMEGFEKFEQDGIPAVMMQASYEIQGVQVRQLQYMYNAENACYSITFTQMGDYDWISEFEAAAKTISLDVE